MRAAEGRAQSYTTGRSGCTCATKPQVRAAGHRPLIRLGRSASSQNMQVEFRRFALRATESRAQSDAPGRNGSTCKQTPSQKEVPYVAHPTAKQQPRLTANPIGQNLTSTFLETRNCFSRHIAFPLSPGFNVGAKKKSRSRSR